MLFSSELTLSFIRFTYNVYANSVSIIINVYATIALTYELEF